MYDVTDRESFSAVQSWMSEIEKAASESVSRILIGNKCDAESRRQVSTEEGAELAEHYCVRFMETSAKDSRNVEQAFTLMTREIKNKVVVAPPTNSGAGQAGSDLSSKKKLGNTTKVTQ